jgi:hypothetical protein
MVNMFLNNIIQNSPLGIGRQSSSPCIGFGFHRNRYNMQQFRHHNLDYIFHCRHLLLRCPVKLLVNSPKVYLYNYSGFTQRKFEQAVLATVETNTKFISFTLNFFKFLFF